MKYAPEKVAVDFPEANLMVCEQTFCWLGIYISYGTILCNFYNLFQGALKKCWIVCLKPTSTSSCIGLYYWETGNRNINYILIIQHHKNGYSYRYTEYCYTVGKYPLLPSAKIERDTPKTIWWNMYDYIAPMAWLF